MRWSRIVVRRPRKRRPASARYRQHKEAARALVRERLAHFNQHYGHLIRKIAIRDQRTRWGSCSRAGNLNFNYRLALLPPHLADYVIVHELCHLRAFDHSPAFWDLVAIAIPDYAARKLELRQSRLS